MKSRGKGAQKRVMVFFTGGTITMTPRAGRQGVVPGNEFERLFAELRPRLPAVQVEPVAWSNLPSPHVTPERMFDLARDIDRALARPSVCGAVVLHGTDVLVESAYMADLTVRTRKPVVFTGSMRYYSETGFDGIRNLLNGIKACVLPLPPSTGVVLLMTDRIFSARDVIKVHSLNVDAFEAPECGPVAYVAGEEVRLTHAAGRATRERRPLIRTGSVEPRVGLVSCYTGMDGGVVEHFLRRGVAGLVVEGFGAGNVPPGVVPALEKAVGRGLPVVLTTRVPEGGVWPVYAYSGGAADLRGRGLILGGRLSAPKARVKLMVALGAGFRLPAIRRLFEEDI
jgi:L-asparaginase